MKQIAMLKKEKSAYGGELMKRRAGRKGPRPLATRESMHLVLRSSQAKGAWSFRRPQNDRLVRRVIEKFAVRYGVRVMSMANVGNHLHLQIKLSNRFGYGPFIRAVTGTIAHGIKRTPRKMAGKAGASGSSPRTAVVSDGPRSRKQAPKAESKLAAPAAERRNFWDYRPFTRVVQSLRAILSLRDYIRINQLEGEGFGREHARFLVGFERLSEAQAGSRWSYGRWRVNDGPRASTSAFVNDGHRAKVIAKPQTPSRR